MTSVRVIADRSHDGWDLASPTGPPLGIALPFGDQFVGRFRPVGERASPGGGKGFQVIETYLPHSREHDRRFSRYQFVCCCQVSFVPELLIKKAHQRFVLKAEALEQGPNVRFVVATRADSPLALYN